MLHSRTFPGLRLAAKSLLDGDFATVLSALNEGIDTPEHAAFAARLRTAAVSADRLDQSLQPFEQYPLLFFLNWGRLLSGGVPSLRSNASCIHARMVEEDA